MDDQTTDGLSRRELIKRAGLTGIGALAALGNQTDAAESESKIGGARSEFIDEPPRQTPVAHCCDICVIGGSCTGLFAAVAAARLGANVAIIENHGFFGGVATASLVNIWHSLYNTDFDTQIIAGLTEEVLHRLRKWDAVVYHDKSPAKAATFNSAAMILELDRIAVEAKVRPFLHTRFVAPIMDGNRVTAAVIEDKSGRRAIRASYFIDATGDGDLVTRMGIPTFRNDPIQPATLCAIVNNISSLSDGEIVKKVFDPDNPQALRGGFLWSAKVPGLPDARMIAGTRVHGADLSDADQRTNAEIEGRRQVRAMLDIIRGETKQGKDAALAALPARIGIRETRHAQCQHILKENEVLDGTRFPDAIANGSYRVDIHDFDRPGITFRYLDGREHYVEPGVSSKWSRWRSERDKDPTFYQIPYRSLLPVGSANVLVAGRVLGADRGAFGAVRVMVNCNQTGEAAGTAAHLALDASTSVAQIDTAKLRGVMQSQGSIII